MKEEVVTHHKKNIGGMYSSDTDCGRYVFNVKKYNDTWRGVTCQRCLMSSDAPKNRKKAALNRKIAAAKRKTYKGKKRNARVSTSL